MIKLLLAIVALIPLAPTNVNGQDIKFGIKAGLNYATIAGDYTDGSTGKLGYHFGAYGKLIVTDKFSLKPELLYSLQGVRSDQINNLRMDLSYLNIPILASVAITEGLNLEFGPQIGVLMGAKIINDNIVTDIKKDLNSFDYGVAAGLIYELEMGLNLGLRYILGLGNILDTNMNNLKQTNQVMQLSVGYTF